MTHQTKYGKDETIEGTLLEFTGEGNIGTIPVRFGKAILPEGSFLEVLFEPPIPLQPSDSFRATATNSIFRPDHSKHMRGDQMVPWLQYVEVMPAARPGSQLLRIGERETKRPFPESDEAEKILNYLAARSILTADVRGDAIRIEVGTNSHIYMRRGRLTFDGILEREVRPIRAVLDYAKIHWNGQCVVEAPEQFKQGAWAQAQIMGVTIPNYEPSYTDTQREEALSFARLWHFTSYQRPPIESDRETAPATPRPTPSGRDGMDERLLSRLLLLPQRLLR